MPRLLKSHLRLLEQDKFIVAVSRGKNPGHVTLIAKKPEFKFFCEEALLIMKDEEKDPRPYFFKTIGNVKVINV